ncbi:MAG: GHKL domain-containing protein, partial [Clostridia bacterium]|nr:GHKL domain-containing protein [Clostridia bacterium]
DELLLAKMDTRLIVQVIINILDNAMKYTPSDSTITVTTEKQNDKAIISIADNGSGIPDELKERVFDMFYTGANKLADSRRSIGLGLALCKSIISVHGGEIFVKDNVPSGAIFTFTLPIGEIKINE